MKSIKKPITSILNKQVLVLNQNYHPLLICTAKRAISLAFLGKVKVVENYKQRVSSPSLTINLPSVVKLDKFVNVRNNNLEQAMRVLKGKVQKEGIVKELRERQFYKKPSEIRQEKIKEARKNWIKKQKKLEKIRGF